MCLKAHACTEDSPLVAHKFVPVEGQTVVETEKRHWRERLVGDVEGAVRARYRREISVVPCLGTVMSKV